MIKKILILLLLFSNISYGDESKNSTIFAESNLAIPLVKIVRKYSKEKKTIIFINLNCRVFNQKHPKSCDLN